MEGVSEVYYRDLCDKINKVAQMIAGGSLGQPINYFDAVFELLLLDVKTLSKAAINSKYSESMIVGIFENREDYPNFLKTMAGTKSTKINWIIENLK